MPHRFLVCALVAFHQRLIRFPSAQLAEITRRRVLEFRRELPSERMPTAQGNPREAGELLQPLPPIADQVPRHWHLRILRRWEHPGVADCRRVLASRPQFRDRLRRQWRHVLEPDLVILCPPPDRRLFEIDIRPRSIRVAPIRCPVSCANTKANRHPSIT